MLPKFASHVLHQTQRAAATAQNYAIRNVLGLQNQSSTPGSLTSWSNAASGSSSGWGSAGGAKSSTGNWFYQGYTGAGRAVTQANSSAHDTTTGRIDEDEDLPLRRSALVIKARPRPRSSSVHLTGAGRLKRAETLGVLKIVQLHQARAQHVQAGSSSGKAEIEFQAEEGAIVKSPRSSLRRRNSTASSVASLESIEPTETTQRANNTRADSSASQKVGESASANLRELLEDAAAPHEYGFSQRFEAARMENDPELANAEVLQFRETHPKPNVLDYNDALHTLVATRRSGEPLTAILETYNEMLTRQIKPNARTYKTMILALCERDREVERVLTQIQSRMKRRRASGRESAADQQQLRTLRKEENFGSSMLIFEAAQTLFRTKDSKLVSLGSHVYIALLRSCMLHANTDAAVRVWGIIEQLEGFVPDASCYLHLLGTYVSASDIESAKDVFSDFLAAANEKRVFWVSSGSDDKTSRDLADEARAGKARVTQMLVWVKMIEAYFKAHDPQAAIGVLEQMMDTKASERFGETDIPPPCPAVYTAFIRGFLEMDDVDSAMKWFNRMLSESSVASTHPLMPTKSTPRPDQYAWRVMLDSLVDRGMRTEFIEKFKILQGVKERDGLTIRMVDRLGAFDLNEGYLKSEMVSKSERDEIFVFLRDYVFDKTFFGTLSALQLEHHSTFVGRFTSLMATDPAWYGEAMSLLQRFVEDGLKAARQAESDQINGPSTFRSGVEALSRLVSEATAAILSGIHEVEPLAAVPLFHGLYGMYEATQTSHWDDRLNDLCVETLKKIRARGELSQLDKKDWRMFFGASSRVFMISNRDQEAQLRDLREVSEDTSRVGLSAALAASILPTRVCQTIYRRYGDDADAIIQTLPAEWAVVARETKMRTTLTDVSPMVEKDSHVRIDKVHSRMVDEYFPSHPSVTVHTAYTRYEEGACKGIYPLPDVLGRLIASLGRLGEVDKVHRLYNDGQQLLATYENNRQLQSHFWYCLEDQMIVAMAHAGHIDKAHVHRHRILSQGGVPSADAYGGLIQCVRETTDDSSNALALWHEATQLGVVPNMYLYNTIISKLSRARKADLALDLFRQMKATGVRPSSVTYGAVIAACCRVGDAQSAETLFEEMTSQQNFKPRVPPYNTMLQFYTHTVRDRERALFYYNALLSSGIKPTAHTYKLLIDCYGTIEPVDVAAMENVFSQLVSEPRIRVAGVHWAALINASGCVQKNLEKAIEIFNSIATHPSTRRAGCTLPDAIVYEAMINVLVTLRRTDLIPEYLERLTSSGIHITAYIANLLIKGYATTGDLEKARDVFECLHDPPVGMAAPNNHVPHDESQQSRISVNAPVYREPSTWETMVRAELGNGNREAAESLLARVRERQFPPAVYGRISGILQNDAVSPWFAGNEPSEGSATQSPL